MTVASDDIPRPKPQKPQQTRARFRYREQDPKRAHLKPDAAPADATFICIMQLARYPGKSRLQASLAWRLLIEHCTLPPKDPILLDSIEYCYAHLDSFSPNAQDFIKNMMDAAQREKGISDKQIDYLWDLFNKLVRQRKRR